MRQEKLDIAKEDVCLVAVLASLTLLGPALFGLIMLLDFAWNHDAQGSLFLGPFAIIAFVLTVMGLIFSIVLAAVSWFRLKRKGLPYVTVCGLSCLIVLIAMIAMAFT